MDYKRFEQGMDYKRLGQRIREERLKLNLTQSQLAEDIDISDTYVGQIERGERSLTLDTLVRLVNRLGVTIDYLLKDYVIATDDNTINQFRQIIDSQSDRNKQMAIDVLKTMFAHLDE
ncbi:MAG: helix-turn-helix domain-containing protein [Defluviitaleaceae bacterium]|nr:helix-turn-helix domain-containing protein [Defluviitaleaceae bacterium]